MEYLEILSQCCLLSQTQCCLTQKELYVMSCLLSSLLSALLKFMRQPLGHSHESS